MGKEQAYYDCKYSYPRQEECPHVDNDLMKQARKRIPIRPVGDMDIFKLDIPDADEVNMLCKTCDKFTRE